MSDLVQKDEIDIVSLPDPNSLLGKQAKFFDAHPEKISAEYLNNFVHKLPAGFERESLLNYFSGRKFGDFDPSATEFYSKKKCGQTVEEFIKAIDDAISKVGIRQIDLERKVKQFEATKNDLRITYGDELNKQMVPVYLELRKAGYNHLDIV